MITHNNKGELKMKRAILLIAFVIGFANTFTSVYGELASVGPVDPNTGFPQFYTDTEGVSLVLGINDPVLTPFDPVIPENPFSVQVGFGGEAFYWAAEATIPLRGGGNALLVLALEAAWANEDPEPGQQVVFGRVRIRIDVPDGAAGTYTIIHPFGEDVFVDVVPDPLSSREINMTRDIGGIAGDFTTALTSDIGPFLIAVNPAPPVGFVGNPGVEQTVTGSPTGNNLFSIIGPPGSNLDGVDNDTVLTDVFFVQGEIAVGPLPPACTALPESDLNGDCKVDEVDLAILIADLGICNLDPPDNCVSEPNILASPDSQDFGTVTQPDPPSTATFIISNVGNAPLVMNALSITGSNASDFTIILDNCSDQILPVDPTPDFLATLSGGQEVPPVDTIATGSLALTLDEGAGTIAFRLAASNITDTQASHIHFGAPGVNGPIILFLFDAAVDGPFVSPVTGVLTSADFIPVAGLATFDDAIAALKAGQTYCNVHTTVNPGGEIRGQNMAENVCRVTVSFKPATAGLKTATLSIPSNDPDENPLEIPLIGDGGVVGGGGEIIIVDNLDAGASSTGIWLTSVGTSFFGVDSMFSEDAGDTFTFQAPRTTLQEVSMWWTARASRSTNVQVQIFDGATLLSTVSVNQQVNGGQWNSLGTFTFTGTARVTIIATGGGTTTSADAVRFAPPVDDNLAVGATPLVTCLSSVGSGHFGGASMFSRDAGYSITSE